MSTVSEQREIRIGQVVSVQVPKREVRVAPESDAPDRWATLTVARFRDRAGRHCEWPVKDWRTAGRNVVLVLDGPTDDQVAALRKAAVVVDEAERAELPDDMFYIDDVIGVAVFSLDGARIGEVEDVMESPAQALLEVRGDDGVAYTIAVADETVPEVSAERVVVNAKHLLDDDGMPYKGGRHAD